MTSPMIRALRERALSATPDPDLGPGHIYGDHSAGSYRRWLLGGGPEREEAYIAAAQEQRRRALLQDLWRRVHPEDPIPPDVLDLTNYGGEPPGEPPTTADEHTAAGPRAGHLTTKDEGSALSIDGRNAR